MLAQGHSHGSCSPTPLFNLTLASLNYTQAMQWFLSLVCFRVTKLHCNDALLFVCLAPADS